MFHQNAFSSKCFFIKMPFHQNAFSSKRQFIQPTWKEHFIEVSFHPMRAFSSLAPFTESTIELNYVSWAFQICNQICFSSSRSRDIGVQRFQSFLFQTWAVLRAGQAGSYLVFSLAYLALSLPWLKELLPHPQLQQCQGSPAGARPTCQEPPLLVPVLMI
jgi:hypothetical protein